MADEKSFDCTILTPDTQVYSGSITDLVAPGADGSFGVLRNHAPLVSALGKGELRVHTDDGSKKIWNVEGGFLEVHDNKVSVLAEHCAEA